jgi:hypothetical protein
MSAELRRWYPSKIDRWLVPVLCVPPAAAVAVCVAFALVGSTSGLLVGGAMVVLVAGIYFGLVVPTRYGVCETYLLVRFGLCLRRVPLYDISEVRPTHNPLSSPALSLDRLHVQYGRGLFNAVMISPADRNGFLDNLARIAGLKREGDRLVRV